MGTIIDPKTGAGLRSVVPRLIRGGIEATRGLLAALRRSCRDQGWGARGRTWVASVGAGLSRLRGERDEGSGGAAGERLPEDAPGLTALAQRRRREGDLEGAEPLFRRALEIRREALGGRHPEIADYLNQLAELRHLRGDLAGAEALFRRALEIRREALGGRHPETAATLSNLGLLQGARGDSAGAEALFRQALEIRREALGEDHPDTLVSRQDLAALLRDREGDGAIPGRDDGRREHAGTPAESPRAVAELPAGAQAEVASRREEPPRAGSTEPGGAGRLDPLDILARVLALSHRDDPDDPALSRCKDDAAALARAIAGGAADDPPPEAGQIAGGTHPLAALLRLVQEGGRLSDHEWAYCHLVVKEAYGKSLASAATRARLVLPPPV